MEEILLDAEMRQGAGRSNAQKARREGFVPGVVYGGEKHALAVQFLRKEVIRLAHERHLENSVIKLKIKDDKKQSRPCVVKEIQYDPVHGDIIHLDFNEISLTKAIKINVPVTAKGEPVGVKQDGGALEHILWELEVECLPTNIPKEIEVDVSALKIGDSIHVKDIQLPPDVKALNDPGAIVLSVAAPIKEEAAPAEVEGEEKKEPEVIKEKKEVPAEGKEAEGEKK